MNLDTQALTKLEQKLRKLPVVASENYATLDSVLDRIQMGNIIFKDALTEVIIKNRERFYQILYEETIEAATRSGEYDYPPYLERLSSSISLAEISVHPKGKSLSVEINLNPLGDIVEWGNAVKETRDPRPSRKKKRGSENAAYVYWRDRGYARSKYDETIAEQLSKVQNAPFWYLIEHGNANPPGFQVIAPAYPKVQPQRFIENTRRRIFNFIDSELQRIIPQKESEWVQLIANTLGITVTPKLQSLLKEYESTLVLLINNLQEAKKVPINGIVGKISTTEKEYNIIVTSESLGLRNILGRR
jgi:hypothetical protein